MTPETIDSGGVRNFASALHHTEFRCPEKGLQVIAAERCIQNAACPRARTCELRPVALRLMAGAREETRISLPGQPVQPPKKTRRAGRTILEKTCAWAKCARPFTVTCSQKTQVCCSHRCAGWMREASGHGRNARPNRTGKAPGLSGTFLFGRRTKRAP